MIERVLLDLPYAAARRQGRSIRDDLECFGSAASSSDAPAAPPPLVFEPHLRELRVAGLLVLNLTSRAVNLCAVLKAFQDCDWQLWIVDPLGDAGKPGFEKRLHDAVYELNRRQKHRLLDFSCDGDQRIVRWNWHRDGGGRSRGDRRKR